MQKSTGAVPIKTKEPSSRIEKLQVINFTGTLPFKKNPENLPCLTDGFPWTKILLLPYLILATLLFFFQMAYFWLLFLYCMFNIIFSFCFSPDSKQHYLLILGWQRVGSSSDTKLLITVYITVPFKVRTIASSERILSYIGVWSGITGPCCSWSSYTE